MRWSPRIRIFVAIFVLTAASSASAQQVTVGDAAQKLTGGSTRVWVHQKTTPVMGSAGQECTSGRTYRFAQEGSVLTISECVDGKMNKTNHQWVLKQASPIDVQLIVDGTKSY